MFGELIKEYRKVAKKTQETMAYELDISINHLSRIERGRSFPSGDLIHRILTVISQDKEFYNYDFDNQNLYGIVVMIYLHNFDNMKARLVFNEIMKLLKIADIINYNK